MNRSLRARKVFTLALVLVFVSMVCMPAAAETWSSREATETLELGETLPVEVAEPPSEEAIPATDQPLPVEVASPVVEIAASAYLDAFEVDDSAAEARSITLGVPESHTIHVLGDEDWVKFDVAAGGRYRIETLPGDTWFDTEIYVYASDGTTLLDSDNDSGYGGTFSAIDLAPSTSETVYVRAVSLGDTSVGAYRLSVTGGPFGPDAYEEDDSLATAGAIVVDAPAQERTFHVTSDDDYVSVDLVAGQDYVFRTLPGDADLDTVLYLYDSNRVEEGYSDDDGTDYYSTIYYTPTTSGTYYLLARPYGYSYTGRYLLEATADEAGDPYEVDDSPASAKPITTDGTRQDRSFHVVDDLDYVSFQAVAGVEYQVETHEITAGLDTEMYVYDSDGTTEIAYNDDGGYSYMSYISFTADETETLYVLVHSYSLDETGEYSLTVLSLAPDSYEVDDTSAEAKQILPGVGQQRTFHQDVDPDWVKLDVIAGLDYTITTRAGSDVDTVMYLYDTDGTTELDYDDDSGPAYFSHIEYSATESKTVYIMVRGYWKGAYQLDVECDDLTPPTTTSDALPSYNVSARISLSASDPAPGVGVATTYYILDGAAKQVYSAPITVGAAGAHTLQYWSVDRVTNEESVKSVTFQVIAAKKSSTTSGTSSTATGDVSSAETTTVASVTATPTVAQEDESEEGEEQSEEVELTTTSAGDLGEESDDGDAPILGWALGGLLLLLMIGGVAAFARKK